MRPRFSRAQDVSAVVEAVLRKYGVTCEAMSDPHSGEALYSVIVPETPRTADRAEIEAFVLGYATAVGSRVRWI